MIWFQHVSDAVYDALAAALGMDPDLQSTADRIVPAYVQSVPDITTPQYNSNDDVLFFAISEEASESESVFIKGAENALEVTQEIPISVLLTFYGPNADDRAEAVRLRLMVDTGANSPRAILRKYKIVLNYGLGKMPPRPVSIPELEGTLWRRRCDLRLSMNYLAVESLEMNPVEEVPEVGINMAE